MNIKIKLILSSTIITLGLITLIFTINFSISKFNILKNTQTKVEEINKDILMLRRNEKDFLIRKDIKYLTRHNNNYKILKKNIIILKKELNILDIKLINELKHLETYIKLYKEQFIKLVHLYEKVGLSNDKALLNRLNNNVIELRTLSLENLEESLELEILKLLELEKSFLLTSKLQEAKNFSYKINHLLKHYPLFKNIKKELEKYKSNFEELIKLKTIIGLDENLATRGLMRENIHASEKIIKTINNKLNSQINKKIENLKWFTFLLVSFIIILTLVSTYMIHYNIKKYLVQLKHNKVQIEQLNKKLTTINDDLEKQVIEEVSKNLKKEIQLFESSKLASMGAMIGNIIHQWKQPLNLISLKTSSLNIEAELNNSVDSEHIKKETQYILDYLSRIKETTETFRNFLKEKKELKKIILQDRINESLIISGTVLKDKGFILDKELEDDEITIITYANELTEVIINIINNAIDILEEKSIEEGWVKVTLLTEGNYAIITIEDNAGGIPKDILPNIFDEYFTTKDETKGTGLGLYMSKKIVVESLKGDLRVENTKNGAKFFIALPLNS